METYDPCLTKMRAYELSHTYFNWNGNEIVDTVSKMNFDMNWQ